jgi:hypothetical protein
MRGALRAHNIAAHVILSSRCNLMLSSHGQRAAATAVYLCGFAAHTSHRAHRRRPVACPKRAGAPAQLKGGQLSEGLADSVRPLLQLAIPQWAARVSVVTMKQQMCLWSLYTTCAAAVWDCLKQGTCQKPRHTPVQGFVCRQTEGRRRLNAMQLLPVDKLGQTRARRGQPNSK